MNDVKISLAAARVNAQMTQDEVAKRLKVSKATVVHWEKGRTTPSFATINTLSDMYHIPIDCIFLPEKST